MAKKAAAGSIYRPTYRRPDGTVVPQQVWWIKYYRSGLPVRESAKTASWDEAQRLLKRRQGEVVTGRFLGTGPERIRLSELVAAVEDDYREKQRRTLADMKAKVKNHILPALGHVRAAELGTAHLRRYIAARRSEDASNASINRELAIISRAYHLGLKTDPPVVTRMPSIERLPEDNVREGFLDHGGYRRLLSEMPPYLRPLFVVAYHTGVRRGELRQLRLEQVAWEAGEIHVSRRTTKNKDAHTLPIYGDMRAWLEMAKAERDMKHPECPWLFFDDSGRQIGSFRKAWASACKRANVPGLLFHDLRRSAAINMDRAGIPRRVIMEITGHKTEAMFLRYRIVSSRDLRDAATRMENWMNQPDTGKVTGKVSGLEDDLTGSCKPS